MVLVYTHSKINRTVCSTCTHSSKLTTAISYSHALTSLTLKQFGNSVLSQKLTGVWYQMNMSWKKNMRREKTLCFKTLKLQRFCLKKTLCRLWILNHLCLENLIGFQLTFLLLSLDHLTFSKGILQAFLLCAFTQEKLYLTHLSSLKKRCSTLLKVVCIFIKSSLEKHILLENMTRFLYQNIISVPWKM